MNLNFGPEKKENINKEGSFLERYNQNLRKKKTFQVTMNFMTKSVQVNLSYN